MSRLLAVCLRLLIIGLSTRLCLAAPAVTDSIVQPDERQDLQQRRSNPAREWGLTDEEWATFEHLQAGPRRYWSPNLDPLTTLGVEATSDQQRRHYAELQVRLEARRAEGELAYQKAYTLAWSRLYPDLLPVQGLSSTVGSSPIVERDTLFVEEHCSTCQTVLKQLLEQGKRLDLFLVDSQGDDQRLRQWARHAGITPVQVREGKVTLNHDRGRWFGLGAPRPLPVRYQKVDDQWLRVE